MKIQLIALDMDGTTLRSDGTLSERNRSTMRAAAQRGVFVVPATGRVLCELPQSVVELPEIRYAITSNGASVLDLQSKTQLYANCIPIETIKKVWELLRPYDVFVECYLNGNSYASRSDLAHLADFHIKKESVLFLQSVTIAVDSLFDTLCSLENPKIEKLNIRLRHTSLYQELWSALDALPELSVTSAGWGCIEVNNGSANKGDALLRLCGSLAVAPQNAMAVGDGLNDREMLLFAGLSVAMGNSYEEILGSADFTTLTCDEDGVALAIEKYVLGSEPE